MPILILFVGVLLIAAGINNKIGNLKDLITEDFRPSGSIPGFHVWVIAIIAAGSLGYIKAFKPFANAFLVLIFVGLLLSNKGFFEKFTSAIQGK
jgi:uncharacterized membrane protein HdeD (DUF308 family)